MSIGNQSTLDQSINSEDNNPVCKTVDSRIDYILACVMVVLSTYLFINGNVQERLIILIISSLIGIFRPKLLIFSISLASSLDVTEPADFTPMRVVIIIIAIALLVRFKYIKDNTTRNCLVNMVYLLIFALWCIGCTFVRFDFDGTLNITTTFIYAIVCLLLLIIIPLKESIPTYIWLGLVPTVILSITPALHLRVAHKFEYLVTQQGLRFRGILNDPNYLSSILLVGFATCLVSWACKQQMVSKIFYFVLSGSFFFAIWETQSRGGIYTAFICTAVLILSQVRSDIKRMNYRNLLFMPIIGLALIKLLAGGIHSRAFSASHEQGFVVVRGFSDLAIKPLLEHPIFGFGEASFVSLYGQAAHNTIISMGLEYGVLGMFLLLTAIIYSFLNLWRHRHSKSAMFFFLPLLALNIILCSFSGSGHKFLWFYLAAAAVYSKQTLPDETTNLAACGQ